MCKKNLAAVCLEFSSEVRPIKCFLSLESEVRPIKCFNISSLCFALKSVPFFFR